MAQSILEQLRVQTRPAHQILETQPLLKRLLSSRLSNTEYGQLLQSMLAFYQALEVELVPAAASLLKRYPDPAYWYLPRAPLLATDCQTLGYASSGFTYPPLKLQLNENDAYLLGVLYVIEGATQGGRVISRHLAHTLGISEDSGASFFNIHRRDNSWATFCRWLGRDLECNYQEDIDSIVEGADMTFFTLHTHLDQWRLH